MEATQLIPGSILTLKLSSGIYDDDEGGTASIAGSFGSDGAIAPSYLKGLAAAPEPETATAPGGFVDIGMAPAGLRLSAPGHPRVQIPLFAPTARREA